MLEDVSLDIPTGSRFCLLGGSGSGKSVLIKLILGLTEIDQGEIYIEDQPISKLSREGWQATLSHFGVVFQGAALFDSLNVLKNVGIRLFEERKESPDQIKEKVIQALEAVNLSSDILIKYPEQLSGGMKKRVAIARAILHQPRYLVYDEPTTGLDPESASAIDELIENLAKAPERTSLIITHDMHTVKRVAREVALIHDRRISFYGSQEDFLKSNQEEVQAFLNR